MEFFSEKNSYCLISHYITINVQLYQFFLTRRFVYNTKNLNCFFNKLPQKLWSANQSWASADFFPEEGFLRGGQKHTICPKTFWSARGRGRGGKCPLLPCGRPKSKAFASKGRFLIMSAVKGNI